MWPGQLFVWEIDAMGQGMCHVKGGCTIPASTSLLTPLTGDSWTLTGRTRGIAAPAGYMRVLLAIVCKCGVSLAKV
jgi:hypothetical protein